MNKREIIITIIATIALGFVIYYGTKDCGCSDTIIDTTSTIKEVSEIEIKYDNFKDSINTVNEQLINTITLLNYKLDSINKVKRIINNKYETIVKNMDNVIIIDDDSVARYIANQIANWKGYRVHIYGRGTSDSCTTISGQGKTN